MLDHDNISDTNGILGRGGVEMEGCQKHGWKLRAELGSGSPALCSSGVKVNWAG